MSNNEDKDLLQQITYLSRLIKRHRSAARPVLPNAGNDTFHLVRNDKPSAVLVQPSCSYNYIRPPAASSSHHYQSTSFIKQKNEAQYANKPFDRVDHQTPSTSRSSGHLNFNPTPKTILINPNFKKTDQVVVNISNSNSSIASTVSTGLSCATESQRPKTILLNPNFKGISKPKVHINTKFFSNLDNANTQNCTEVGTKTNSASMPSTSSELPNVNVSQKYFVKTNRKLVRDNVKSSSTTSKINNTLATKNPLIKINNRKLVRMPAKSEKVISEIKVHKIPFKKSKTPLQYKSKKIIISKSMVFNKKSVKNIYKLKRTSKTLQPLTNSKYKFVRGGKDKSLNKFHLDHRMPQSRLKNVKKYSLKYESSTIQRRRSWQSATFNRKSLSLLSPSNKTYRYRKSSTSSSGLKLSEFSIGGQKYVMDANGKTLKRVAPEPSASEASKKSIMSLLKRIHVAGVTYAAKAPNVYVRTNDHKTRTIVSQAKYKSISVLVNKLRKNNQPCVFYHRFGKCIRKEKGTCPCVHDPKQIAICKKFLQGKCEVTGCLLSHDVRPEKMPTCQYFLDGCCVRDPCPYLHVKVSENAEVCQDFLNGFCSNSDNCKKKHVNICPEVNRNGKCTKGKFCPYPHPKKSVAKRANFLMSKKTKNLGNSKVIDTEEEDQDDDSATRYYQKEATSKAPEEIKSVVTDPSSEEESEEIIKPLPKKRPKLGPLPSYIPI